MRRNNIIVIGVSTGGPRTLKEIFSNLPPLNATIVIVQHMSPSMVHRFARSMNTHSLMDVNLAQNKKALEVGKAHIAPGGVHLKLKRNLIVNLHKGDKVNYCCPSVDVTMKSLTNNFGTKNPL